LFLSGAVLLRVELREFVAQAVAEVAVKVTAGLLVLAVVDLQTKVTLAGKAHRPAAIGMAAVAAALVGQA
jgi:hypothetical protein